MSEQHGLMGKWLCAFFCHGNCSLVAIPLQAAVRPSCQLKESRAFLGRILDKIMGKLWDYERIINEIGPFVKRSLTCCRLGTEPYQIIQLLPFKVHPLYIQFRMQTLITAILSRDEKFNQSMTFKICFDHIDQTIHRVLTCLAGKLFLLCCVLNSKNTSQLINFCFLKA